MNTEPPLASVIVACRNQLAFTRHCIPALGRHTRGPWELIAIDDGSTDGTAGYLAGVQDAAPFRVEVLANPAGLGLAAAYARGIAAARGEYLVLLGNDAVVTDAWLDQLVALARSGPAIGATGPMSNHAGPRQRADAATYPGPAGLASFAARWRDEHRGRWFTAERLSGPCVLLKRSALEAAGGLGAGPFDEADLASRIRRAGFEMAVAKDLFVHSFGAQPAAAAGGSPPPPSEGMMGPAARLRKVSLTMIVRDEEANLPACLDSARGLFDEIIVVDTGSGDRTVELARARGASVSHFAWIGDFAAARNAALSRATGDFAFWLDADDRVEPAEYGPLKALLDGLDAPAAYVVRCACDAEGGEGAGTVVDHIRLFPLRPEHRWAYRVHEQILPSLRRAGVEVRWSGCTVRHTGYNDPALRLRKLGRDRAILEREAAERPDDPFVLFNLAQIALETGDPGAALGSLRRSLAGSAPEDSIARKAHALIALCHQRLGDPAAARAACEQGLAAYPDDAELLFRRAIIHRLLGESAEAAACWRKLLTLAPPERFSSVDSGIFGHISRKNLAALVEEEGDRDAATRLWEEVLAERPGDAAAAAALLRLRSDGDHSIDLSLR